MPHQAQYCVWGWQKAAAMLRTHPAVASSEVSTLLLRSRCSPDREDELYELLSIFLAKPKDIDP